MTPPRRLNLKFELLQVYSQLLDIIVLPIISNAVAKIGATPRQKNKRVWIALSDADFFPFFFFTLQAECDALTRALQVFFFCACLFVWLARTQHSVCVCARTQHSVCGVDTHRMCGYAFVAVCMWV